MARYDWAALLAVAVQIAYKHDTRPFLSLAKGLARQTKSVQRVSIIGTCRKFAVYAISII